MTCQARSSYLAEEVNWGHRFSPMMLLAEGFFDIDYGAFHHTFEVDTHTHTHTHTHTMHTPHTHIHLQLKFITCTSPFCLPPESCVLPLCGARQETIHCPF